MTKATEDAKPKSKWTIPHLAAWPCAKAYVPAKAKLRHFRFPIANKSSIRTSMEGTAFVDLVSETSTTGSLVPTSALNRALGLRAPQPATETQDGWTWNFHEKCRKNTPRPENLEPNRINRIYRENAQNRQVWYFGGIVFRYFSGISGYLGGILGVFSGGPEFRGAFVSGSCHLRSL